jgi:hypothetical protein
LTVLGSAHSTTLKIGSMIDLEVSDIERRRRTALEDSLALLD